MKKYEDIGEFFIDTVTWIGALVIVCGLTYGSFSKKQKTERDIKQEQNIIEEERIVKSDTTTYYIIKQTIPQELGHNR